MVQTSSVSFIRFQVCLRLWLRWMVNPILPWLSLPCLIHFSLLMHVCAADSRNVQVQKCVLPALTTQPSCIRRSKETSLFHLGKGNCVTKAHILTLKFKQCTSSVRLVCIAPTVSRNVSILSQSRRGAKDSKQTQSAVSNAIYRS